MTGDKPDPRIRTPMQWTTERAAGFTTGMPWEPLQPDSFAANVAAMDRDPGSLLSHYRRLVHLRASDHALGAGTMIPLDAGMGQVAAWLRRVGDDVALVVANLGEKALGRVALSSAEGALAPGRYDAAMLLGDGAPPSLAVAADGRVSGYAPLPTLAPLGAYVVRMSRATAGRGRGAR